MNVMVIYDSVFGNTEKIARAIGQALNELSRVDIVHVHQTNPEQIHETDLLIIGSPTRGFRPTPAVTAWMKTLQKKHLNGVRTAVFDTRIDLQQIGSGVLRFMVHKGGYAADKIRKQLEKKGGSLTGVPEGFLVTGEQGPLKTGETERAGSWARQIFQVVINQRNPQ
jgi:flavodoxin